MLQKKKTMHLEEWREIQKKTSVSWFALNIGVAIGWGAKNGRVVRAILKLADRKEEGFCFVATHHHVNGDDGLMLLRKPLDVSLKFEVWKQWWCMMCWVVATQIFLEFSPRKLRHWFPIWLAHMFQQGLVQPPPSVATKHVCSSLLLVLRLPNTIAIFPLSNVAFSWDARVAYHKEKERHMLKLPKETDSKLSKTFKRQCRFLYLC